jgi:hypothetical protein
MRLWRGKRGWVKIHAHIMGVQEVESLGDVQRDLVTIAVPLQLASGVTLDYGAQVPACSH